MTDTQGWPSRAAALLLMQATAAFAGEAGLDVVRLSGSVTLESPQSIESLRVGRTIGAGQRVRTEPDGHTVLQLPPVGALALAPDTALFVHSVESVDLPARSGLARIVLEQGTVRINTRAQQQLPPADLRVNVGTLRLRVFGAEVWIERSADTEEVCLLGGAIELQSPLGARRLDEAGQCLLTTPAGLKQLDADAAGAMAPRLAQTAFPGDPTMLWVAAMAGGETPAAQAATGAPADTGARAETASAPSRETVGLAPVANASMEPSPASPDAQRAADDAAALRLPPAPEPEPEPEPEPQSEPEPEPQPQPQPQPAESSSRPGPGAAAQWTIVLASFPEEAIAQKEAARLRATGIDTEVIRAERPGAPAMFRVVSGRYPSKADVEPDIEAIRARRDLRSAWVLLLQ